MEIEAAFLQSIRFPRGRLFSFVLLGVLLLCSAFARADDEVPIPGGPAAVRRLLGLDPERPKGAFFLDVHESLVFNSDTRASWGHTERRKAIVDYTEDFSEWRTLFGDPAIFRMDRPGSPENAKARRLLDWLGYRLKGEGKDFTAERRDDAKFNRRQACVAALGAPVSTVLARLRSGETVTISAPDETVPLPFGLAAWRETLDEPSLSAAGAFLSFVKNVRASRMLVALHSVDPETRDGLRTLFRDEKGRSLAWRRLYEKSLDPFSRYPEALILRDGRFVLPGGREAEPVWADVFGVSPADRVGFFSALYQADSGKAAYVLDVLQQLPDAVARDLLLGKTGGGARAVKRFRRLYRSIDRGGESTALTHRDPYDFAQLASFLRLSDDGDLLSTAGGFDGAPFPRSERELAEALARQKGAAADDLLRALFRNENSGAIVRYPAQRRFLFVASLVERRPDLDDRGLLYLLATGLDRFWPAYAAFENLPIDASAGRRYLFTLDRLDRRDPSRDSEVATALFQCAIETLSGLSRAEALSPEELRDLFTALLDQPLFASPDATLAEGEPGFGLWLSEKLLPALRRGEARRIESARAEKMRRESEYRDALAARDARILERRAAEQARREAAERDAAQFGASLNEPVCSSDDSTVGPAPSRYQEEARTLVASLATSDPDRAGLAETWLSEAREASASSAAAAPPPPAPRRIPGRIPGTSALLDPDETLPRLVSIDVPEESSSPDDLLTRSLVGAAAPAASFGWRGARYRFDAAADESSRRQRFREKQRLTWLAEVESLHVRRDALLAAAARGDVAGSRAAAADLARALGLEAGGGRKADGDEDGPPRKVSDRAREAYADISRISKPKQLARVREELGAIDALLAERDLEALLGHAYASSACDPDDLYFQDPRFVRRHNFRVVGGGGRVLASPFERTVLLDKTGGGSRIAGSMFGLSDALGLLHADQIPRQPGATIPHEEIRSALVASIRRMSIGLLDDDALEFVDASCRATEELAGILAQEGLRARSNAWSDLAKDIVTPSRLGLLAALPDDAPPDSLSRYLSPSDLFLIGRRIAGGRLEKGIAPPPSASRAARALERLRGKFGDAGARERIAQFGPRAVFYAGRFRLTDADLPPYERLASYRTPQLLSDRLFDLKIAVARRVAQESLPSCVLPLVLPGALDELLGRLKMGHPYDWGAIVRAAWAFGPADLDRLLDQALQAGRLLRDQEFEETEEIEEAAKSEPAH